MDIEKGRIGIQNPHLNRDSDLALPLAGLDRSLLTLVGGKAANLGELIRAGFTVPPGFCLTTRAYELQTEVAGIVPLLAEIATVSESNDPYLQEMAPKIYHKILQTPISPQLAGVIAGAYQNLLDREPGPVAVRSSATAEDLPGASFAGQQETILNVSGMEALLEAVRRCWASLWLERVVTYRHSLGLDYLLNHPTAMAVIVQRMVKAEVAGVLFTANPLSGKRQQVVIDTSLGLGEAVVSGSINPDHFVVNSGSGEIVEYRPGSRQAADQPGEGESKTGRDSLEKKVDERALTDSQVNKLAVVGKEVEAYFGSPQDLEWAFDRSGSLWLLQARPITTLYPLPHNAPLSEEELRVYLSFNTAQGTYRPFTPLGTSALRLVTSSVVTFAGFPPADRYQGPGFLAEAGLRLFIDLTPALRSSLGRKLLPRILDRAETRTGKVLAKRL